MPNEVFTIKPLEWEQAETKLRRGYVSQPPKVLFYAFVFQSRWHGTWSDQWCLDVFTGGENDLDAHLCASLEEGKRLAEEHWQSYIKQALVPVGESE